MDPTEITKIMESFKYVNEELEKKSASIFIAPLEHSLSRKVFKRNLHKLRKDGWGVIKGTNDPDGFKAYFADNSATGIKQIFHLDHIGNEAIRKSITSKMFTLDDLKDDKAIIDSIENAGTMLELLPSPNKNFIGQDLYFESDYFPTERYHFVINYVHLWLFNTGIGMLCFKAKLIRVEDTDFVKDKKINLSHIARFNRCMRCLHEIRGGNTIFYSDKTKIAENHFFKEIVMHKWLSEGPNQPSRVLGLSADIFKAKLLDKQYSHMKVFTWAYLDLDHGNEQEIKNRKLIWDQPYLWPKPHNTTLANDLSNEDWTPLDSSMHYAVMEGYPSVKDYVLYDLAETGDYLSSMDSNNMWALNPEYLKSLLLNQHIEMYMDKDGLATFETLAFISTRTHKADIGSSGNEDNWESNIYPLYILLLHVSATINKFENITTDAYKAPERYLQHTKDFQMFRNSFWFHQYGNKVQDKIFASKIINALDISARFNHLEKEMQEVANSIVQVTQQYKAIALSTALFLLYPIWLWADANQMLNKLKQYYRGDPYESLSVTLLAALSIIVFFVIFSKPIKRFVSFIWAKVLSFRYHDE